MKTIKQLADEIGVTKQAVHQKRKNKALSTALHPFTSIVDGIVYISVDGEKLIKSAFVENERKRIDVNVDVNNEEVDVNESSTVDDSVYGQNNHIDTIISMLQRELDVKNEQLAEKDKQIDKLTDTIKAQAQSINADRHNELAGTMQRQLAGGDIINLTTDKPKGRWQRIKEAWRGIDSNNANGAI